MSFPYNANLPNPPNNPSSDVGGMQTNAGTINNWTQVDHIGFNDSDGGKHLQLQFPDVTTQITPSTLGAVVYTTAGTAISSQADLFMKNSGATLALSAVKAFAIVDGTTPLNVPSNVLNGFNVPSVTRTATGTYTVTLASGIVSGTNYAIIGSSAINAGTSTYFTYSIVSSTSFTVQIRNLSNILTNASSFSFVVIQL